MEFLKVEGKTIQRASIEDDDLSSETPAFRGDFDFNSVRMEDGDQSGVVGEGVLSTVLVSAVDLSSRTVRVPQNRNHGGYVGHESSAFGMIR